MSRVRRTSFLIDREVQGSLMLRVILYWCFCILTISLMLICLRVYQGPKRPFVELVADLYYRFGPALGASLILLPIVVLDVARMSNRFVGPISRLRQGLQASAEGR